MKNQVLVKNLHFILLTTHAYIHIYKSNTYTENFCSCYSLVVSSIALFFGKEKVLVEKDLWREESVLE